MTVSVLWLFITMHLVGLQYLIMVFSDHTHLPFRPVADKFVLNNRLLSVCGRI